MESAYILLKFVTLSFSNLPLIRDPAINMPEFWIDSGAQYRFGVMLVIFHIRAPASLMIPSISQFTLSFTSCDS